MQPVKAVEENEKLFTKNTQLDSSNMVLCRETTEKDSGISTRDQNSHGKMHPNHYREYNG